MNSDKLSAAGRAPAGGAEFDWTLMRSFLAALDTGSLLAASRQLKVSQPTLGRHINELETQLRTVLFERTGRGLRPTEAAFAIAEHARAMQGSADALRRTLTGRNADTEGTVRITASEMVASFVLPALIAKLQSEEKGLQIELIASDRISNLLRRDADIAVRMVRPSQVSLVAKKIASVSLGLFAHQSYLNRYGEPRTVDELLSHRLIGYDTHDTIIRGFARYGFTLTREHFVLRSDNHAVAWQAVVAGVGIGILAEHMAAMNVRVSPVLPGLALPSLPIWLTVHREIRTNRRIRRVYDFLAQTIPAALAART